MLPSPWFSRGLGYFNTVATGCFSWSAGWSNPKNFIFSPWKCEFTRGTPPNNAYFTSQNMIFTGGPTSKHNFWAAIRQVLLWKPGNPDLTLVLSNKAALEMKFMCSCPHIVWRQMLKTPWASVAIQYVFNRQTVQHNIHRHHSYQDLIIQPCF